MTRKEYAANLNEVAAAVMRLDLPFEPHLCQMDYVLICVTVEQLKQVAKTYPNAERTTSDDAHYLYVKVRFGAVEVHFFAPRPHTQQQTWSPEEYA